MSVAKVTIICFILFAFAVWAGYGWVSTWNDENDEEDYSRR